MEFLEARVVLAIHDAQLAQHGGLAGVRDAGLLESELARPQHAHHYGVTDVHALAASLAYGIARNHPFLDGNKRTAWACARTFLKLNGTPMVPNRLVAVEVTVQLAQGHLSEADFAAWLQSQPTA